MNVTCFKPVINENCTVLILGSVPSVKSRENGFYYGNPANRFWKILSKICDTDFTALDNEGKTAELLKHRIALYDVFSACEIQGSSDGSIKNATVNDIPSLVKNTAIKTIYITSAKAYGVFMKKYGDYFEKAGINVVNLPSTSGANRSKFPTDDALLSEWKNLLKL